jgi:Fe-S cluster assembly scaffold protein SufB
MNDYGDDEEQKAAPAPVPVTTTAEQAAHDYTESIKAQREKKMALAKAIETHWQCDKELSLSITDTQAKLAALRKACESEGLEHGEPLEAPAP